jgi:D-alanyl-D-alanine carboxypeptidase
MATFNHRLDVMAWRVQPVKLLLILMAALIAMTAPAEARKKHGGRHHRHRVVYIDPTPRRDRDAAIVIDASNGNVLYERYADEQRFPASLTKMMTLYMLFEALQKGQVSLSTTMTASAYAADQDPTKLGLDAGDALSVEDAIKAIVVRSANDAAVVIAEHLGGSEMAFAQKMTAKARELGMTHTQFVNASGLPDEGQLTTARDLSVLSRHLITDFPQYYPYFHTLSLYWNGRSYEGHNSLLKFFDGADGIKTGYTRMSGYNLATSAVRRGTRLIAVVMGGQTAHYRDVAMAELLEDQFTKLGLGRPSPTVVAMSPLVPDDDEVAAAQRADSALEAKPEATPTAPAAPAAPASPAGTAPSDTIASAPVPDDPPTKVNPRSKPVLASTKPSRESQGDREEGRVARDVATTTWGIQVGAYSDKSQAEDQLKNVRAKAADLIGAAKSAIVALDVRGESFYRVRFGAFTPAKAEELCKKLQTRGISCLTVTAGAWDEASSRAALPVALQ